MSLVWSKRLDRENPNVVKIAERAESLAMTLRSRLSEGVKPSTEDARLYQELVFYLLYDRFEARLERAMTAPEVDFYDDFLEQARFYVSLLQAQIAADVDAELAHWFAFLFQVRRASHHIFDFIVGSSLPAARLRGAARRYCRFGSRRGGDQPSRRSSLACRPGAAAITSGWRAAAELNRNSTPARVVEQPPASRTIRSAAAMSQSLFGARENEAS